MGLDVGDKTIGIAISDPLGWTAQSITTIRRTSWIDDVQALGKLIQQFEVDEFVVGLPKNMNGTLGERAERSMHFAKKLEAHFKLPVHLWDERLTSASAERVLLQGNVSRKNRKQHIDKLAAVFILQSYMDANSESGDVK